MAAELNVPDIAAVFAYARKSGETVLSYPGPAPETIEDAYAIQDRAIALSDEAIGGWKVGRITGAAADQFGIDRLAGPVWSRLMETSRGGVHIARGFRGGFIAIEGEVVIILAEDAPADKINWTAQEATDLIAEIRVGVEIASSPYARVNDDGPLVTITDLGNNHGLIIGDEIPNWQALELESWKFKTFIDDRLVGEDNPASIPGGPIESLRFLLENTSRRGLPLKKGMAVLTGAVTGVHTISIGQTARVECSVAPAITCRIEPALTPHSESLEK